MRLLQFVALACLFLLAGPGLSADKEEDNAKKIVGTWEAVKGEVPPGTRIVFTKDGKLKVTVTVEGKTINIEGTYKVEGNTLKVTTKEEDQEKTESVKIKTLTETKLVTENKKGTLDEFKKK